MVEVWHYVTSDGTNVFETWLDDLVDASAAARVVMRVNRFCAGNFGDCKPVGSGAWEFRVDLGQGYRIYHAKVGSTVVLLLSAGDIGGEPSAKRGSGVKDLFCRPWRCGYVSVMDENPTTPARPSRIRSIGRWSVEVLLVLVIAGLILATWMPAIVTHQDKVKAEQEKAENAK